MENKSIVIDSNVFYASLNIEDSLHEKSLKLLEEISESIFIVPYSVLSEVSTLLSYRQWKEKANEFIQTLKNTDNIFIVSNSLDDDIELFLEIDKKISFTDISLISICKKYNAHLATFDKQLISIYKKIIK